GPPKGGTPTEGSAVQVGVPRSRGPATRRLRPPVGPRRFSRCACLSMRLVATVLLFAFSWGGSGTLAADTVWPPPALSARDHVYVVPVEVSAALTDPPALTFRFWKTDYALDIYRKSPEALDWGTLHASIPAGTAEWRDTTVERGVAYAYRFHARGVPAETVHNGHVRTFVLAGVEVDRTLWRGRVVLVMPASIQTPLAWEIARFREDLVADGWTVHEVLTPDGRDDWLDAAYGDHVAIRDEIRAIYAAHPGEVKHVILLGRVPQPRSGLRAAWAPDGHGDLGAVAADAYYADVDNEWTDTGTITVAYGNQSGQVRPAWHNNPGDGRFDQSHFRHLPEAFEMGWGRIDFRRALNGETVNGGDEIGALRDYLNKLHAYKHARDGFKPGRRALVRDDGGLYKHLQEEFWKTITPLSGMANLDYVDRFGLPAVSWQTEAQYTFDHGPYLYVFMAGNEPNRNSDMSRAVFWTGFKSHVGYWDLNAWMRQSIAYPNSWTLSWTFSPPRGRYLYHKMALGGTMGDVMKATINNQSSTTGLYGSAVRNHINGTHFVQNPFGAPGDYSGFTFMGHMGDPTLREHMIESPPWLRALLCAESGDVTLAWAASPEGGEGYHLYAAAGRNGPYDRITGEPVRAGETAQVLYWKLAEPPLGKFHFKVRAVRLETTPSGTYLNASLGALADLEPWPDPPLARFLRVAVEDNRLHMDIPEPPEPIFAPVFLESPDLRTWTAADPRPTAIASDDGETLGFRDHSDLQEAHHRFLRFHWGRLGDR
ncbi:MAG: hypothetical protein JJT96_19445, partial [Opitutales bacterium]|nr:hypothetical protein [Opitutales bacterium]